MSCACELASSKLTKCLIDNLVIFIVAEEITHGDCVVRLADNPQ